MLSSSIAITVVTSGDVPPESARAVASHALWCGSGHGTLRKVNSADGAPTEVLMLINEAERLYASIGLRISDNAVGFPSRRLGMSDISTEKRIVAVGPKQLEGILRRPRPSSGLVIFAHGAGSSRLSTRNNHVADRLAERGIATLLFDLLTEEEASDRANVFDIPLLSERMIEAVHWARDEPELSGLPIGLFGASTGAAAALVAAAQVPEDVRAVVSRGGRPDLAGAALARVKAPTLLVVGGADYGVIELNERAAQALRCQKRVAIVPGATHLFEQPGTLDQVVDLAAEWFAAQFGGGAP